MNNKLYLESLDQCRLFIGSFPHFDYDASGGGGEGTLLRTKEKNIYNISFSKGSFSIPPLTSKTTKFLSIPLPPGIKIEMNMDKLLGTINDHSGEIILDIFY